MPLVIDASSPASHTTGISTPANTCAAFTPPSDPLLLAMWAGDSQVNHLPAAPTVASSPSQTWVTDGWDARQTGSPSLNGQAAVFHALVAGSPGSTTVTVTNNDATTAVGSILKVYVVTDADPVSPIGVTGGNRQDSGSSLSDSFIASISGSQGFMVVSDWAATDTTTWAPAAGCTIEDKATIGAEISYAVVRRTDPDSVVGLTTDLGITGLVTGGNYHWVYAEVISQEAAIAAGGQAGYPAHAISAPMF